MLVRLVELVADKRGHTWFNPARAERNQPEPDVETDPVCDKHRQARLTHAVNQAEPEYDVVFAVEPVRQPAAQQREKVNADDESVKNVLCASGAISLWQIKKQRRDEKDGQNVPHPVKTEALASLVADDVADLSGDRRLRIGRNARRKWNVGRGCVFHHREGR